MITVPALRKLQNLQPGIFLNYGGSRGTLFAIPIAGRGGSFNGDAVLFGSPQALFRQATIAAEQSFLIVDAAFELGPLLQMDAGTGALEPGCLAADDGRVAIATRDAFDDLCWVEIDTGSLVEPRDHRHFFRSWKLISREAIGTSTLFIWPPASS